MKDDVTRRAFLKSAGLTAAGIVGSSLLSRPGFAQEDKAQEDKKEEDKKKDAEKDDDKKEPDYDDLFGDSSGDEETRACPQCGALMYRQGRTWSCEACGYSYVE